MKFKVGDYVRCLPSGKFKEAIQFCIDKAEVIDGFNKYFGGGVWHREDDITLYSNTLVSRKGYVRSSNG